MVYVLASLALVVMAVLLSTWACRVSLIEPAALGRTYYVIAGGLLLAQYWGYRYLPASGPGEPAARAFLFQPLFATSLLIYCLSLPVAAMYLYGARSLGPSMIILTALGSRGPLSEDAIVAELARYDLVDDRLRRLCAGGYLSRTGDEYRITRKGAVVVKAMTLALAYVGFRRARSAESS